MILAFEFEYLSQNGVLENLLESICKDFGIEFSITKQNTILTLQVQADTQKLENFADFIAKRVPLSIFFKSSSVTAVDSMKSSDMIIPCELVLPFTPRVLAAVEDENSIDFMNPFIKNEIGLSPFDATALRFEIDGSVTLVRDTYADLFAHVAKEIKDGKAIRVNTASGSMILSSLEQRAKEGWSEPVELMPTDLSVVEKMVVAKENEIKALASLEKPIITMRLNSVFRAKELIPSSRVRLGLANDLILHFLSKALFREGVEFVCKDFDSKKSSSGVLGVKGSVLQIPAIEVVVLENGEILITKGDGYSAHSLKENRAKFDLSAHAQFATVLQEHDLFEHECTGFYLSREHDDMVMHYSDKSGFIELLKYPLPKSMDEIFAALKESSSGIKILNSYQEQFPELYKYAMHYSLDANLAQNIANAWGIAAVILGISRDISKGSQKIIELAEDFGGNRGPRIDCNRFDKESIATKFDFIKMIHSALSFKLAGADDMILSFGMVESFAYFIADCADFYKAQLQSERLVLCGSLFGIKRFSELTSFNLVNSHKIAFNREVPIDS